MVFDDSKRYGSAVSPLNSSWIQRLIPSHSTRLDQHHTSDDHKTENHGTIDGLQLDWNENIDHSPLSFNEFSSPLYENSRRSKQDFHRGKQACVLTNAMYFGGPKVQDATSRQCEAPGALQPEVLVSPKPLPVVESLLPGCPKKAIKNEVLTERNKPHNLSRSAGFLNQIKETVMFSSEERSRVSYSSINGLACFNSTQLGKKLDREFLLSGADSFTRHEADSICGGKSRKTITDLCRMNTNPRPEADPPSTLPFLHSDHTSLVERGDSVKDCVLLGCCIAQRDERLHDGAYMNKEMGATRNRDHWHGNEGTSRIYDTLLLPFGANHANEKGGNAPFHRMIEQEACSSHGSHEGQTGTSVSFSFHFGKGFSKNAECVESVKGKGQWPFFPTTVPCEVSVWSRRSFEDENKGVAEATKPRIPPENLSTFQRTDAGESGNSCMRKSGCSPFFGVKNLQDDISPYSNDTQTVTLGAAKMEGVHGDGVDQVGDEQEKARGNVQSFDTLLFYRGTSFLQHGVGLKGQTIGGTQPFCHQLNMC